MDPEHISSGKRTESTHDVDVGESPNKLLVTHFFTLIIFWPEDYASILYKCKRIPIFDVPHILLILNKGYSLDFCLRFKLRTQYTNKIHFW